MWEMPARQNADSDRPKLGRCAVVDEEAAERQLRAEIARITAGNERLLYSVSDDKGPSAPGPESVECGQAETRPEPGQWESSLSTGPRA